FFGNFSYAYSKFNKQEPGLQFGGSSDYKKFGYFFNVGGSVSDRFLDPVNFNNLHNHGDTQRFFSRFDYQPSSQNSFSLDFWTGRTNHDIPNLLSQQFRGQDDGVLNKDGSLSLSWTHLFNANTLLELHPYFRSTTQNL